MICNKCGRNLPGNMVSCPFCKANNSGIAEIIKNKRELSEQQKQAKLLSDQYGVDKRIVYKEKIKENKLLGALIILGILLFIVLLVILIKLNE